MPLTRRAVKDLVAAGIDRMFRRLMYEQQEADRRGNTLDDAACRAHVEDELLSWRQEE